MLESITFLDGLITFGLFLFPLVVGRAIAEHYDRVAERYMRMVDEEERARCLVIDDGATH